MNDFLAMNLNKKKQRCMQVHLLLHLIPPYLFLSDSLYTIIREFYFIMHHQFSMYLEELQIVLNGHYHEDCGTNRWFFR